MSEAEQYKNLGNDHFKKGEFELAVENYSKAIELDPQNHVLYSNKAAALINLSKNEEALQVSEECLKINS